MQMFAQRLRGLWKQSEKTTSFTGKPLKNIIIKYTHAPTYVSRKPFCWWIVSSNQMSSIFEHILNIQYSLLGVIGFLKHNLNRTQYKL